jgi:protein transport protein SEC20
MSAKRSLEAAQSQERQLLLQSYLDPAPDKAAQPVPLRRRNTQTSELSKDEKTINASTDVTLALRRTHDMMAAELSRSQFAHDTLQESTAALAQLSETYSTLDTLLSSSRNLLGTLLRSQKSDTWYLETAFYILLTTIFWLVFRRLLYGPTWWLVWWPLKLFWRGSVGILATTGIIRGSSGSTGVSSIVGQETALYSSVASVSALSMAGSQAPSISVGGEGRAQATGGEGQESVSEQIGKIIDESRDGQGQDDTRDESAEGQGEEGQAEVERNPKKRMWDAEKEAAEAPGKKDEL